MKIVYIATSSIPSHGQANSIQVMQMCNAFSQVGHETTLIVPNKPDRIKDVEPFNYYGIPKTFNIKWLPWLPAKGRGYIFGWLASTKAKGLQPDLVYGRSIVGCFFSALLGIPTILEIHSPVMSNEVLLHSILRVAKHLAQVKKIVSTSNSFSEYLQAKYKIPSRLILVAQNGSSEINISTTKTVAKQKSLNAGYLGSLRSGKGMEIIAELVKLTPWIYYHIVGGEEADVNQWKKRLNTQNNITFYGQVSPSDVGKYYNDLDVLLAPYQKEAVNLNSNNPQNTWLSPLKLMEYMATGKPILCSNLPPYREILTNKRNALLCDPDKIDDWVIALNALIQNKNLRQSIGMEARKEFLRHYTWKSRAQKILSAATYAVSSLR